MRARIRIRLGRGVSGQWGGSGTRLDGCGGPGESEVTAQQRAEHRPAHELVQPYADVQRLAPPPRLLDGRRAPGDGQGQD